MTSKESLDQGYGRKKEWETTLPDLQKYVETGVEQQ